MVTSKPPIDVDCAIPLKEDEAGNSPIMMLGELLRKDFGQRRWIVEGIIPQVGCGFVAGPPKHLKSYLVLDLAVALASGGEFLGCKTLKGSAIYIGADSDGYDIGNRIKELANGRGLRIEELVRDIHVGYGTKMKIDSSDSFAAFEAYVRKTKPSIVIIDPMSPLHSLKENDRDDMQPLLNRLKELVLETQTFLLLVHHSTKSKESRHSLRGSSTMSAWYDSLIEVTNRRRGTTICSLSFELKNAKPPDTMKLHFDFKEEDGSVTLGIVQGQTKSREHGSRERLRKPHKKILAALRKYKDGILISHLSKEAGIGSAYLKRYLEDLKDLRNMGLEGKVRIREQKGGRRRVILVQ